MTSRKHVPTLFRYMATQISALRRNGKLRTAETSAIVITHYQRLLDYIRPDFVHVLINGQIVKTGTAELAQQIEEQGFDWIKEELA